MSDTQVNARQARDAVEAEKYWGMNYAPESRATPERLAYEARERGDAIFQIDIVISVSQGWAQLGQAATRTYRPMEGQDWLGAIEGQGWKLEHFSTSFAQHGSSSSKRVLANVGSTELATHGALIGVYIFRRA